MNELPDFTSYGYKIIEELGRNREGGRITWKAISLDDKLHSKVSSAEKVVVIKQFCFATFGSSWSGYKAYEREIKLLQKLNHVGIPCYLDSLETDNGFCLVQEYKNALSLDNKPDLNLAEIKIIITKILEILVYLQQQTPPIIHCDLKPANILVDDRLNVYIVDFGFASLGNQEISGSSVFKGTPGFMPPEQAIALQPASDLYSLGVTIICLLTGKTVLDLQQLVTPDNPYQLKFKSLLSHLNPKFVRWLEKMIKPKLSDRFASATEALTALDSLDLTSESQVNNFLPSPLTQPKWKLNFAVIAWSAMLGISTSTILAINTVIRRVELSFVNLVIAIIGAIVITMMQIGIVVISTSSDEMVSKSKMIAIAVAIPSLIVSVAGIILGLSEAIALCAAIVLAEAITFAYFWANHLRVQGFELQKITINFLLTIGLGIALGLGLTSNFHL